MLHRFICLSSVLAPALGLADVTIHVPKTAGQPMPKYFFGTYNRASGHIHVHNVDPGEAKGFVEASLYIHNQRVYHGTRDIPEPGDPWLANWNVDVVFDSTHFVDGTNLEVKFIVKDNLGVEHVATGSAPVKNQSMAFQCHDQPGNPPQYIESTSRLQDMKYVPEYDPMVPWNANYFFDRMRGKTVVVYIGHGESIAPRHSDSAMYPSAQPISAVPDPLTQGNYKDHRMAHMGQDAYPPMNNSSLPPINLLYLLTCYNGGSTSDFHWALYPHKTFYKPLEVLINQGFVGYTRFLYPQDDDHHQRFVFESFKNRSTLFMLRGNVNNMYDAYLAAGGTPIRTGPVSLFDPWEDIGIYGDQYMRLKGVWRRAHDTGTQWYRLADNWDLYVGP